jgi:hypothetical protein
MNSGKPPESDQPAEPSAMEDYVVHQYGLTRDQARELVKQHGGDKSKIDAAAGWLKAQKRE